MRVEPDARDNGRQSYCRSLMCTREITAMIFPWRAGEQGQDLKPGYVPTTAEVHHFFLIFCPAGFLD